jgi:hypothetical protein
MTAMMHTKPDAPVAKLSNSFIEEAKKCDRDLRQAWDQMQKDYLRVGAILHRMQEKAMHVALGYTNFKDYIREVLGKGVSQALAAKSIYKELAAGPNPTIHPTEIAKITQEKAARVVSMKRKKVTITKQIVKAAQSDMSTDEFIEKVEKPALKKAGKPVPEPDDGYVVERVTIGPLSGYLSKEVAEDVKLAFEYASCPGVVPYDGEKLPVAEKAIHAIVIEFINTYRQNYEQYQANQEAHDRATAEDADALERASAAAAASASPCGWRSDDEIPF